MTSYNKAQYLKRAIDSVLDQKVDFKYEIIIVDDGSDDGSIDIIKSYSDKRIGIFLENHKGIIDVDSEPGRGTTISITFPLKKE